MGNKCRFECPQGSVPSHPQGIRCRAPRLEQWDIEHGTEIRCLKVINKITPDQYCIPHLTPNQYQV